MNLIWKFLTLVGFPLPTPHTLYFLDAKGSSSRPDFWQLRALVRAAETSQGNQLGPQPRLHTLAPQRGKKSGPFAQSRGRSAGDGGVGYSEEAHGGPGAPMSGSQVVFLMAPTSLKPASRG